MRTSKFLSFKQQRLTSLIDQVIAIVNRANGNTVPEYTVTIAPCVDMALILAFCVSMDLKWKEMEKSDAESVAHGLDIVSSIMQIAGGGG